MPTPPVRGGSTHMAFDVGYRDGITDGRTDQGLNVRPNYRATPACQSADRGYRPSAGDRDSYKLQFRDGSNADIRTDTDGRSPPPTVAVTSQHRVAVARSTQGTGGPIQIAR
jgi:hypothetical protein